ncbi:MAG: PEP-CTERM sorting domain-containing protein [Verrucomicrobiae bacterium]|nr:PEP-CTERM sorting domain-containing protein [Verrucomicrobiae bacterium]NNJ86618.1 PEP-CTERM sorting domain-containing protein [Akkermansiaceae bacterium]
MKKNTILLSAFAAAAIMTPASAATVAYWNASAGANQKTLTDLAGGDHNLASPSTKFSASGVNVAPNPVPNPDALTTGGSGSIFINSGTAASVSSGDFEMTSSSSFTFEGWVQIQTGGGGVIAGDRHQSNGYDGWYLVASANKLQFYANTGGAVGNSVTSTADIVTATTATDGFHHFAAVWDHDTGAGNVGTMSLYIDGVLQGTVDHDVVDYNSNTFGLAGRDAGTSGSALVDGLLTAGSRLDELRFSDQALAPSQFLNAVPVPEPSVAALIGLAGLGVLLMRRRRN